MKKINDLNSILLHICVLVCAHLSSSLLLLSCYHILETLLAHMVKIVFSMTVTSMPLILQFPECNRFIPEALNTLEITVCVNICRLLQLQFTLQRYMFC